MFCTNCLTNPASPAISIRIAKTWNWTQLDCILFKQKPQNRKKLSDLFIGLIIRALSNLLFGYSLFCGLRKIPTFCRHGFLIAKRNSNIVLYFVNSKHIFDSKPLLTRKFIELHFIRRLFISCWVAISPTWHYNENILVLRNRMKIKKIFWIFEIRDWPPDWAF